MTRRRLNRAGSAAVEFALTAPVLITLLLGCYDLGTALMVRFKLSSATQTVADLVTQSAVMSINDISNDINAGADALAPFPSYNGRVRITNVATNGLGVAFVFWSCGAGMTPFSVGSIVTSTASGTPVSSMLRTTPGLYGLLPVTGFNTSYVQVETQYVFTAPAGLFFRGPQTFTSAAYAMPRVSTYIGATNILGTTNPLGPSLSLLGITQNGNNVTCNTPAI